MTGPVRRAATFPARLDAFPRVAAFVQDAGAQAGFGGDDLRRLTLVVEELFTNTVVHGHGGDCDEPVHLEVEVAPGRVGLAYEDTAPPFDPMTAPPPEDSGELTVGGLGLVLVARLASDLAYARVQGRNRISLVVAPCAAADPPFEEGT